MIISRGEIWLVNFNPSKKANEVAKIRPALVLQNNELNAGKYPTTIVLPLTTQLIDAAEPLRYRVKAKEKLSKDSDILIAHIRSVDNSRFIEKLLILSNKEVSYVKDLFNEVIS